jgi:hypothetical protein
MTTIDHQLTQIYCFLDDALKANPEWAGWRRSNHDHPLFTDAEVLTLALIQHCLGVPTLKKTYDLISANYRSAFPLLPSYKQWLARLHALEQSVGHLVSLACGPFGHLRLYIFDAVPLPLCTSMRHGVVRLLREDGARFGMSTKGWFFGFKLHVVVDAEGRVWQALMTSGPTQDRQAVEALASALDGGIGIGDANYSGVTFQEEVAEETDLLLVTWRDDPQQRRILGSVRMRVESVFAKLWEKFLNRIYSRSWLGLWNTVKLKLLHHNLVTAGVISV